MQAIPRKHLLKEGGESHRREKPIDLGSNTFQLPKLRKTDKETKIGKEGEKRKG